MMENEQELEARLASCPPGSHDEVALLNDLAAAKLAKGKVGEAQALYARVAEARQAELTELASKAAADSARAASGLPAAHSAPAAADDGDDDDWETSWEAGAIKVPTVPSSQQAAQPSSGFGDEGEDLGMSRLKLGGRGKASADAEGGGVSSSGRGASQPVRRAPVRAAEPSGDGDQGHVLEVHGLGRDVSTSDIEAWLARLLDELGLGAVEAHLKPSVRWVDDYHALLVCSGVQEASELLRLAQGTAFGVRPFSQASQASRACNPSELLPPRPRPKTTTTVARKLLAHHLGVKELRDKAGEQELRAARGAAKEQRRHKAEALEAAWGDD